MASAQETFSKRELHEDLAYLKEAIEKYNPAIYHYNSRVDFSNLYASIVQSIENPLNHLEFYKAVSLLCAATHEGHFVIGNASNQFSGIYTGLFNDQFKMFPAEIYFVGDQAFILKDFSVEYKLPVLAEVISINDTPIDILKNKLLDYIPGDGHILTGKMERINREFGLLYYWFIDQPTSFKVKIKTTTSAATVDVVVEAKSKKNINNYRQIRYGHETKFLRHESDIFQLDFRDNYAILKFKSFNKALIKGHRFEVKKFYREIFKKIAAKHVEHLIIDVRDNGGGSRNFAIEIVPYLTKETHQGVLFTSQFYNRPPRATRIPKPNVYRFSGNLYLLINGGTFSNGSVIAAYAKEYGNAIVIGKESGSRVEGFVAGSKKVISLPNTLIEVEIPIDWIRFNFNNVEHQGNRGLIPDFEVNYSANEKITNLDKELKLALKLIDSFSPKMASPK